MEIAQNQISATETDKLITKTMGCCSTCFKVIPAEIVERNGKVFMLKECCDKEEVLIENDVDFYKKKSVVYGNYERSFLEMKKSRFEGFNAEFLQKQSPALMLTLTLKCNLDCPICLNVKYPSQVDHHTDFNISADTIKEMLGTHKRKIVTLWGGEPTLRKDLPEIIKLVKKSGNTCSICTNGLKLLDFNYCKTLKKAGVDLVALQFDGFRDDINMKLRGVPLLERKMKILKNLKDLKIKTTLMAVVGKGINEDQIPLLIKFASMNSDFINSVQFIDLYTGNFGDEERITSSDILKTIEATTGVPSELYLEQKQLYFNMGKIARKFFGNNFFINPDVLSHPTTMYLRRTKLGFQPYFDLDWLKKTNEIIENGLGKGRAGFVAYMMKNAKQFADKNFIKILASVVLNGFDVFGAGIKTSSMSIVKVGLLGVKSPQNEDLERSGDKEELVLGPVITNMCD